MRPMPELPPPKPGRRRRGTDEQCPTGSGAEKKRSDARTRLRSLNDSEDLLRRSKNRAIRRNTRARGAGTNSLAPESYEVRYIDIRSQKETEVFNIFFALHPAETNNRSQRSRCGAEQTRENIGARTGYNSLPSWIFSRW